MHEIQPSDQKHSLGRVTELPFFHMGLLEQVVFEIDTKNDLSLPSSGRNQ